MKNGDSKTTDLLPWQIEDAARLRALFDKRQPKISQMKFGEIYEIGSQGMVWQYVNGHRPLNFKAAAAFARGLNVKIEEFSPTLARDINDVAITSAEPAPADAASRADLSDVVQLITLYAQANATGRKAILDVARLAPKADLALVTRSTNQFK